VPYKEPNASAHTSSASSTASRKKKKDKVDKNALKMAAKCAMCGKTSDVAPPRLNSTRL
jgi:hypothetical protein